MGKTELLDIVLKDIKELELLVKAMAATAEVPSVMQELAKVKARNVYDGLAQLNGDAACALKQQLSKVEALADEGVVAQPIAIVEAGSPEEAPAEVFEAQSQTSSEKEEKPEFEEVKPVKEEEIVQSTLSSEKKDNETIAEVITQPVENEKEAEDVQSPIEKNVEPEAEIGTVIVKGNKETLDKVITNERFRTGVRSLNETIQVRKPETRFVVSLKKAININDRFRYQRELFSNDSSVMNAAIEKLDAMNSMAEARQYVSDFGWDENSEVVADFMALLEARFSRAN